MSSSWTAVRPRPSDLSRAISHVQQRKELVRLVYSSHERWPLPPKSLRSVPHVIDLRISVLDSSFNPPTLAHLALARSYPPNNPANDYDARLLLLSVRNADKAAPKPGEATYAQRLEMMILLAQELEDNAFSSSSVSNTDSEGKGKRGNVAVAIVDEPTFVRKSAIVRQFLQEHLRTRATSREEALDHTTSNISGQPAESQSSHVRLSFIMGFDTLERFLAPRYYNNSLADMHEAIRRFFAPPPEGDGSDVVCAWRGETRPDHPYSEGKPSQVETPNSENQKKFQETLSIAQPFIASGVISFTLLTDYEMALSSSEVRAKRLEGLPDWRAMVPARVRNYMEDVRIYIPDPGSA